tara:strand:+ start:46448 stop:46774 length:327 start_codon:yes stop_codon:yes gene_type:complete
MLDSERQNILRQNVIRALQNVYDPEMPSVSVYDLGLIYKLEVFEDASVLCTHTLTSMACPFADEICADIENAVTTTPGVKSCNRQLVFEPMFTMEMVPEETRLIMGWY